MSSDLMSWRKRALLICAAVSAIQSVGCEADYAAPLPNGYSVVRTSADSIGVYGPRRTVERRHAYVAVTTCYAGPFVDGLDVAGEVIVGHARRLSGSSGCEHLGYFVIESNSGEHWLELSKDEFDARCKALGIVPDLKPPSYFKK
jgi:hypothetical protein